MSDSQQQIPEPGRPGVELRTTTGPASPGAAQLRAPYQGSELALVLCFLMVIACVPVVQTCLEWTREERIQFTDVFRYRPTAKNLRQYEATLKEKSWFQQTLRPKVQRLLFTTLKDTGAEAILGREQWLFYRPDVRYLVEANRIKAGVAESTWVSSTNETAATDSVLRTILRFRDQLKDRGIALLVMPVPGKPSVYPELLTNRRLVKDPAFESPTLGLLRSLEAQGVATVNLFSTFKNARGQREPPLYLARDTHWTPRGAALAAETVAARLRDLGAAPPPDREFRTHPVAVARWGDVLEMMQIPGLRRDFEPEQVSCEQVVDPTLGPLIPTSSERPGVYRHPGQKSSVLVLGDSFCRIYQYPEPQSLGELPLAALRQGSGTKRLLPGSAGFVSHLALKLRAPVDAIYSDGGASTDVRRMLSTDPALLEGKRVVVWEFVERDIALGQTGWEDVPLPAKLD